MLLIMLLSSFQSLSYQRDILLGCLDTALRLQRLPYDAADFAGKIAQVFITVTDKVERFRVRLCIHNYIL